MKSSIQWFEDAVAYGSETDSFYTMATVYRDIGKFNRDITLDIEEASDKGKYAPYWENIKELVNTVAEESDESEIIQLEVYKLAMYSMESYAREIQGGWHRQERHGGRCLPRCKRRRRICQLPPIRRAKSRKA